jgi:hypothetical protein
MNRRNALILVAEDCTAIKGTVPQPKDKIAYIGYDELSKNPYKYTELEFYRQVHHIRRGKPELKIESYDIRRNALCKKYGWGIHINESGALALVGCKTNKYKELLKNVMIDKINAFRNCMI